MNAPARVPLHQEMALASQVAAQLIAAGIDEDDPDFVELMASETDILERLRRILRAARHTEAQSEALAAIVKDNRERKARLDNKAERLRGVVLQALSELGLSKLDAPDFSASVGGGAFKVIVTDKTAVPDDLCRITREPDKAQIKAAIIRHGDVPGAELANGEPSLTIRTR
jgi:chromosome condensin MukBEF ATPase and DNA-binding subunit MukB